jgi:hypothetical protein
MLATNSSRPGLARFDFVITDVPRGLFTGTGDSFGDTGAGLGEQLGLIGVANAPGTIGVGDEIAVDRFSLAFTDANGAIIRTFASDNVQIVAQEILDVDGNAIGARQDVVWVLFSIRDQGPATDVSNPNLVPGESVATLRVDTTSLAQWNLTGDATVNGAQDVVITAVAIGTAASPAPAPAPPAPAAVVATFTGTDADLSGLTILGVNSSRAGRARFDFVVTDVPRELFTGTGDAFGDTGAGLGEQVDLIGVANAPGTIGVGDEVAVNRFSVTLRDAAGVIIRTFGADNGQIVAQEILAADGVTVTGARQDVVWVLFSIRDQGGATDVSNPNLVPGASTATLELANSDSLGVTILGQWSLTGDASVNDAQGVVITPSP